MSNSSNIDNITLSVRRIKEISFMIDEKLYAEKEAENPGQLLKVDTNLSLSFTIELNLVFILVHVTYRSSNPENSDIFTEIKVQNVFEISDLKRFQISTTEIILPPGVITMLVSLSVTHTRALMAKNVAGTIMQENIMAIVDAGAVAKHIFPRMFEPNISHEDIQAAIDEGK